MQDPSSSLERLGARLAGIKDRVDLANLSPGSDEVVIATVACGDTSKRLEELTVMLKSAVIFSESVPIKFLIVTDSLHDKIEVILQDWQKMPQYSSITWEIRSPRYPKLSKVCVLHYYCSRSPPAADCALTGGYCT